MEGTCRWCSHIGNTHKGYCIKHYPGEGRSWKAMFVGRRKDAEGMTYPINAVVKSSTRDRAVYRVYEDFEHISSLTFKEVTNAT